MPNKGKVKRYVVLVGNLINEAHLIGLLRLKTYESDIRKVWDRIIKRKDVLSWITRHKESLIAIYVVYYDKNGNQYDSCGYTTNKRKCNQRLSYYRELPE